LVLGLLIASGLVVWLSRHRHNEQARRRRLAEAEFAAILTERNRLAREIHDTLAQGLTATAVQLQLVEKTAGGASEKMVEHLHLSQQLVRHSLEEARNSIWNMRSQVLETGDLAEALGNILKQMTADTPIKTSLAVNGRKRRLSPVVENHLLRVGQEAITNAIKHSGATTISVALDYRPAQVALKVTDDGCGFAADCPPCSDGGFGLVGMRERALELCGGLHIVTAPGRGTTISLTTTLPDE